MDKISHPFILYPTFIHLTSDSPDILDTTSVPVNFLKGLSISLQIARPKEVLPEPGGPHKRIFFGDLTPI